MNLLHRFYILTFFISVNSLKCPQGREYVNNRRRSSGYCIRCKKGRFNNYINSQCASCPGGKYNNIFGATSCIGTSICPSGKYGSLNPTTPKDTKCNNCIPGKYQVNTGKNNCESCPGGQYQPNEGKSSCLGSLICPAGKFGKENAIEPSVCEACPPNTYSPLNGSISCFKCTKYEYQNYPGQSSCLKKEKCSNYKYFNINIEKCDKTHDYILVEAILCWIAFGISFILLLISICICMSQKISVASLLIVNLFSVITSLICFGQASRFKLSDLKFYLYICIHIFQIIISCISCKSLNI